MPVSIFDEENGPLELETYNMTEHPVDGAGVTVGLCFSLIPGLAYRTG